MFVNNTCYWIYVSGLGSGEGGARAGAERPMAPPIILKGGRGGCCHIIEILTNTQYTMTCITVYITMMCLFQKTMHNNNMSLFWNIAYLSYQYDSSGFYLLIKAKYHYKQILSQDWHWVLLIFHRLIYNADKKILMLLFIPILYII